MCVDDGHAMLRRPTDDKPRADERAPHNRFQTLEVGRGIAAAMVAMSHAGGLIGEPRWFGVVPFGGWLNNLNVGVDFFFVLSGFIISFVHWNDIGRSERLGGYVSRRFTRVFPSYWIILTLIVPVYLAVPAFGSARQHDWLNVITSYLLFPMPEQPVLGVAWTLTFEVFFYLMFGLLIWFGRAALSIFALWTAGVAICQVTGTDDYPFSFFGNLYCLQFLLGMAIAAQVKVGSVRYPSLLLTIGLVGFFGGIFLAGDIQSVAGGAWARLLFGGTAGLIILSVVNLEPTNRLRVPAWLIPLGSASYAVYLTHVVAESAIIRLSFRTGWAIVGPHAMFFGLAAAGIACGILYHYLVERRIIMAVRGWLHTPSKPDPRVTMPAELTERREPVVRLQC